ncbi:MAG: ABC transporter permease subunit [Eubacteriales bacterium]|nr:ABC transporter permease subunit [Eubacteriales bacterium]
MTGSEIWTAVWETTAMTLISTVLAYLVGLPLGVLLNVTSKGGLHPNRPINLILGVIVNFLRSVPCLILTVVLLNFTRAIFGRGTGRWYTMIVPLFFSSFAYVARIVEQSLADVPYGEIEAVRSMGASDFDIMRKVLLREARPSLIMGVAVTLVNVIGYTSFAYNIGAGGLIADIWQFYTRNTGNFLSQWTFWLMILLVVLLVQIIQELGLFLTKKLDKRRIH